MEHLSDDYLKNQCDQMNLSNVVESLCSLGIDDRLDEILTSIVAHESFVVDCFEAVLKSSLKRYLDDFSSTYSNFMRCKLIKECEAKQIESSSLDVAHLMECVLVERDLEQLIKWDSCQLFKEIEERINKFYDEIDRYERQMMDQRRIDNFQAMHDLQGFELLIYEDIFSVLNFSIKSNNSRSSVVDEKNMARKTINSKLAVRSLMKRSSCSQFDDIWAKLINVSKSTSDKKIDQGTRQWIDDIVQNQIIKRVRSDQSREMIRMILDCNNSCYRFEKFFCDSLIKEFKETQTKLKELACKIDVDSRFNFSNERSKFVFDSLKKISQQLIQSNCARIVSEVKIISGLHGQMVTLAEDEYESVMTRLYIHLNLEKTKHASIHLEDIETNFIYQKAHVKPM